MAEDRERPGFEKVGFRWSEVGLHVRIKQAAAMCEMNQSEFAAMVLLAGVEAVEKEVADRVIARAKRNMRPGPRLVGNLV